MSISFITHLLLMMFIWVNMSTKFFDNHLSEDCERVKWIDKIPDELFDFLPNLSEESDSDR